MQQTAQLEAEEVASVFRTYGLTPAELQPAVDALRKRPTAWVDFMMRFELGLERPDKNRAQQSALIIGVSYVIGGMIPLHLDVYSMQTRC